METRARVLTALVGVPLLVLTIGLGQPWHFSLLILLVTLASLREYYRMVFPHDPLGRMLGLVLGLSLALGAVLLEHADSGSVLALTLLVIFTIHVVMEGKLSAKFDHLTSTVLGSLYIGYLIPHFVWLYRLDNGKRWVFFILLVIMVGDTAGFFVGKVWGRTRLAPEVSPNKTVEGAVGITVGGVLAGMLGGSYLLPGVRVVELISLAVILAILGQIGDLFESLIKRVFFVKDSGSLLPGHGGILDRIDSLIFPTVFTTYYVRLLHS